MCSFFLLLFRLACPNFESQLAMGILSNGIDGKGMGDILDHEGGSPRRVRRKNRVLVHSPIAKEIEEFEGVSTSAGRMRVEKVGTAE